MGKRILWPILCIAVVGLLLSACTNKTPNRYPANYQHIKKECPQLSEGLSGVAQDPEYGFSKDNPVRIGGGQKNEIPYLQMLLGPNMEYIESVVRDGETNYKGLPLVTYRFVIRGDTLSKRVYLDTKNCRDPQAPSGFNVKEEFRRR